MRAGREMVDAERVGRNDRVGPKEDDAIRLAATRYLLDSILAKETCEGRRLARDLLSRVEAMIYASFQRIYGLLEAQRLPMKAPEVERILSILDVQMEHLRLSRLCL